MGRTGVKLIAPGGVFVEWQLARVTFIIATRSKEQTDLMTPSRERTGSCGRDTRTRLIIHSQAAGQTCLSVSFSLFPPKDPSL